MPAWSQFKLSYTNRRVDARLLSKVIIWYHAGEELRTALTKNISASGAMIEILCRPEQREEMSIEIKMPTVTNTIFTTGQIQWIKELSNGNYNVGLHFTDISENDKQLIDDYVKQRL